MEKKYITKNNVPIYSYPNTSIHSFCISLYIRAGCLYEPDEVNGITHFLEHIAFRNINYIMQGALYQLLDKYGLEFKAATYKEFVQFSIVGVPKHYDKAADIVTKVFAPIVLPSSEIKIERQRIKSEIRESDDENSLDFLTGNIVWNNTPLKNTITGKRNCLDKIGKEKLIHAQKEFYTFNNLFFYVTGCIDEEDIIKLGDLIEPYDLSESPNTRDNTALIPSDFQKRNDSIFVKNASYSRVRFSFDFVASKYTNAELMLLFDILFTGDTCAIHQELSEKSGLIYSYDATLERYNNIGNIYFSFEIQSRTLETPLRL